MSEKIQTKTAEQIANELDDCEEKFNLQYGQFPIKDVPKSAIQELEKQMHKRFVDVDVLKQNYSKRIKYAQERQLFWKSHPNLVQVWVGIERELTELLACLENTQK